MYKTIIAWIFAVSLSSGAEVPSTLERVSAAKVVKILPIKPETRVETQRTNFLRNGVVVATLVEQKMLLGDFPLPDTSSMEFVLPDGSRVHRVLTKGGGVEVWGNGGIYVSSGEGSIAVVSRDKGYCEIYLTAPSNRFLEGEERLAMKKLLVEKLDSEKSDQDAKQPR